MDAIIDSRRSIRDVFEHDGDALCGLVDSKISNHIGFSVLIKTPDKYLVFVKRNGRVSTKKNVIDFGVSGSLKSKYALSADGILTVTGLFDAISSGIIDELHLPATSEVRVSEKNLLDLYRDRSEGGKPNFILFYNISYTSMVLYSFACECHYQDMSMDIDKLVFIDESLFINTSIGLNYILFQQKNEISKLPISPSTYGVITFLKEYLYN